MIASVVPLIDLTPWYAGDADARREVAAQVDEALKTSGFLLVSGTHIPAELPQQVRCAVQTFFAQDDASKRAYECTVGGRGWVPFGAEANGYADGLDTPPDLKESFTFGNDRVPAGALDDPASDGWYTPNRWPAELPELEKSAELFAAAASQLADDLLEIFAVALDLPIDFFTSRCLHSPYAVNLNRYPASEAMAAYADGSYRIGQHTDFGTLTILDRQQGRGGLQVRTLEDEWVDAPFVPGAFTVNSGDLLARWTGDRWRSTPHRVLPPDSSTPTEELVSLIFFHTADPGAIVSTLPEAVAGPKRYPDVAAGEFLRGRLDTITVL